MYHLEIKNLTKRFGGLVALKDVTINVEKESITGLIGPNGSGKTTLFNNICGFYKPDAGEIFFEGKKITGINPTKACHLGIGRTFQVVKPFHTMNVKDNVMIATFFSRRWKGQKLDKVCSDILKITGIEALADSPISRLPLAMRKRVELARALATNPSILLLDEPLAGLNTAEVEEALGLIQRIADKGITIIMVEHVMKAVMSLSEKVIVLNRGEVIAEGRPVEVSESPQVIEAYLGAGKYA